MPINLTRHLFCLTAVVDKYSFLPSSGQTSRKGNYGDFCTLLNFRKYLSLSLRVLGNYEDFPNFIFWKFEYTFHSGDACISSYIIAFSFLSLIFNMQGSLSQDVVVNFQWRKVLFLHCYFGLWHPFSNDYLSPYFSYPYYTV